MADSRAVGELLPVLADDVLLNWLLIYSGLVYWLFSGTGPCNAEQDSGMWISGDWCMPFGNRIDFIDELVLACFCRVRGRNGCLLLLCWDWFVSRTIVVRRV